VWLTVTAALIRRQIAIRKQATELRALESLLYVTSDTESGRENGGGKGTSLH
jgi:hypothetical protein